LLSIFVHFLMMKQPKSLNQPLVMLEYVLL
jgi:hypothetical protein